MNYKVFSGEFACLPYRRDVRRILVNCFFDDEWNLDLLLGLEEGVLKVRFLENPSSGFPQRPGVFLRRFQAALTLEGSRRLYCFSGAGPSAFSRHRKYSILRFSDLNFNDLSQWHGTIHIVFIFN